MLPVDSSLTEKLCVSSQVLDEAHYIRTNVRHDVFSSEKGRFRSDFLSLTSPGNGDIPRSPSDQSGLPLDGESAPQHRSHDSSFRAEPSLSLSSSQAYGNAGHELAEGSLPSVPIPSGPEFQRSFSGTSVSNRHAKSDRRI